MKIKLAVLFFIVAVAGYSQEKNNSAIKWEDSELKFGIEAEALPYFNKGYDFSVWTSYYLFKLNLNWSLKYPADFVSAAGFENLRYKSFGAEAQYFPIAEDIRLDKLWFGFGGEFWSGKVQNSATKAEGVFNNFLFKFSVGYVVFVYKNFYLNPFLSGHLRIYGDKTTYIGGYLYNAQSFTPEISVRIGYHL